MLPEQIESLFDKPPERYGDEHSRLFQKLKDGLNDGSIRAAEPDAASPTGWRVNGWVKKGILLGFRMGAVVSMSHDGSGQAFFDKATYPLKSVTLANARAHRSGRIEPARRMLSGQRRDLHASDVRQCGRLRW